MGFTDNYKVRLWKNRLEENGVEVRGVEELFSKYRANGDLLFALVNADAVSPEGEKLLPLCFIKGEVVCVLICLIDQNSGEKYLLLVRQRRICDGSLTYEHPAGMLDSETDPAAVAIREVWEETGVRLERSQIRSLNARVLFPSTGTSDEAMYLFFAELTWPLEKIRSFHRQKKGEVTENEYITTHVLPFVEGYRLISNTNGLLHCFLYLTEVEDWELIKRLKSVLI